MMSEINSESGRRWPLFGENALLDRHDARTIAKMAQLSWVQREEDVLRILNWTAWRGFDIAQQPDPPTLKDVEAFRAATAALLKFSGDLGDIAEKGLAAMRSDPAFKLYCSPNPEERAQYLDRPRGHQRNWRARDIIEAVLAGYSLLTGAKPTIGDGEPSHLFCQQFGTKLSEKCEKYEELAPFRDVWVSVTDSNHKTWVTSRGSVDLARSAIENSCKGLAKRLRIPPNVESS